MSEQLEDVRANLRDLCEPSCGHAWIEPSDQTPAAQVERVGDRVSRISYGDGFVSEVIDVYGRSVTYAIVAHEYAHHLDETSGASRWTQELHADALAGCALARHNDSLGPALRWMRREHFEETLEDVYADLSDPADVVRSHVRGTHPPWTDRIGALTGGAKLCKATDRPRTLVAFFKGVRGYEVGSESSESTRAFALQAGSGFWAHERAKDARRLWFGRSSSGW